MKIILSVFLFVLFAFINFSNAQIKGDTIYLDVALKAPQIKPSQLSQQYHHIEIEGTKSFGKVGEPVLPTKGLKILIPPNTKVKTIEIISGDNVVLPGHYMIEPGQKLYPINQIGKIKIKPDAPNIKIYNSDAPYFKELYKNLTAQKKMGYSIAVIDLYPVQYNPQKGTIAYYKTMRVAVKIEAESKVLTTEEKKYIPHLRTITETKGIKGKDQRRIQKLIDNKEDLSTYNQELFTLASSKSKTPPISPAFDPSQKYDYVIITRSDFVSNLEPLKARRTQKGLNATIVTTEWIYANYPGTRPDGKTDDQTKIRNFITDAYNNWGTEYVLLAGDADGADVGGESGNNIIPSRGLWDKNSADEDSNIPADLYYSCLDGSFDKNANGIYGEKTDGETDGEVDLVAEVYVGRIAVDSVAKADNFVKKTLAYEDSTDDYLNNNYMVGEYLGFGGVSEYATACMEEIRLGSDAHGYTTEGFLSNSDRSLNVNTLYDIPGTGWSTKQLIDTLNNGAHIINHLGHANVDTDMKLKNSDVDSLVNSKYFFVYSQGCYAGSFDNRTTQANVYSPNDCIAEHLTGSTTGAVAFVGNSRYGWGENNSTASPSQYYNRQFWDTLFNQGITQLGRMNQDSKENTIPYVETDGNRWAYFELNLFGDPSLEIHTPNSLILSLNSYSFVEKLGNGNGSFEPGETVELVTTLKALNKNAINASVNLSSTDQCVSFEQNSISYTVITKGASQDNTANPFKFGISASCPINHTIDFILSITADGYTKDLDLSIKVNDPRMRRITADAANHYSPAISGDKIVWADNRNGYSDVYLYDLSTGTERQITNNSATAYNPRISAHKIVWADNRNGNYDIYLYDLSTGTEQRITTDPTDQSSPAISGDKIVWLDTRNGYSDVYLYDLSTGTERRITANTVQLWSAPAISEDKIVWADKRNSNGNVDVYLYNLSTNTERQITTDADNHYSPDISGDKIVWSNDRVISGQQITGISLYDLSTNTERQITADRSVSPVISGDKIVWYDFRNGFQNNIYFYDLSTNTERQITATTFNQAIQAPRISGDKIVWMECIKGPFNWSPWDIYLTEVSK